MNCINCGSEVTGKYCSECGQKANVSRIGWRPIISEITDRYIGLDNKFARTVRDLTIRPGKVLEAYLSGNRVKYMGPFSYFLVMGAIMVLMFGFLGVSPSDMIQSTTESLNGESVQDNPKIVEFQKEWNGLISRNFRWVAAVLIPFYAIGTSLMFMKRKLRFIEHITVSTYYNAHTFWSTIGMVIGLATIGDGLMVVFFPISLIYLVWAWTTLFFDQSRVKVWFRALAAWVIGYALFIIAVSLLGAAYMIVWLVN